jgi:hypothetical protein
MRTRRPPMYMEQKQMSYVGIWWFVLQSKVWIGFLFSLLEMMAAESLFPRGRGGAYLGPAMGSIFSGLHVLLFHSSLAHWKSGRRDLEQPGGHHLMVVGRETWSLQDSSARCAMSIWLIWLIKLFPHMDLCIPSYSNLFTCLCCCLRLVHCKLHYISHTYCYQSFPPPKLKMNKSNAPWAFHRLKGKQNLAPAVVSKCATQKKTLDPTPLLSLLQVFQFRNPPGSMLQLFPPLYDPT